MRLLHTITLACLALSFSAQGADQKQLRNYVRAKEQYEKAASGSDAAASLKASKRYLETAKAAFGPWADETATAAQAHGHWLSPADAAKALKEGRRYITRKMRFDIALLDFHIALGNKDAHTDAFKRGSILLGIGQVYENMHKSDRATPFLLKAGRLLALDPKRPSGPVYYPSLSNLPSVQTSVSTNIGGQWRGGASRVTRGCVALSFTVDARGIPVAPKLLDHQGADSLIERAKEAAGKMRYLPAFVAGKAVPRENVTYLFDWTSDEETPANPDGSHKSRRVVFGAEHCQIKLPTAPSSERQYAYARQLSTSPHRAPPLSSRTHKNGQYSYPGGGFVTSLKRTMLAALSAITISGQALTQETLAQETANTVADDRGGFIDLLVGFIHWLDSVVFMNVDVFGASVKPIVVWMGAPMVLLTVYFGFVNLTSFRRAWKVGRGDFHDPTADGEVTQFQALSTALSGTVGLGNIAGVAAAISLGGPGATFWMILIGLCAMTLKFAECTLGVKYRVVHEDGTVSGGPMHYLKRGLAARGWKKTGLILGWTYALLALPSLLQVATVNQIYESLTVVTGIDGIGYQWGFGIALAALTAVIIIGGIQSIAKVTSRLVPLMAFIYISAALTIILSHLGDVPAAFLTIFERAFNPQAVAGGVLGVIVIGMQRAVYSTEAGLGSATMAHAAAKTREPMSEGMVALMEPFIDTVVICTMTALVIVISGVYKDANGIEGVSLTASAFATVISWFPAVLAVAAFLFGFSTIISWGYYCSKIWEFVFGSSRRSTVTYKFIYCAAIVPGAVFTLGEVYTLMNSLFFLMAVPNIIGIYLMAPELKRDLKSYLARLKSGEIRETR